MDPGVVLGGHHRAEAACGERDAADATVERELGPRKTLVGLESGHARIIKCSVLQSNNPPVRRESQCPASKIRDNPMHDARDIRPTATQSPQPAVLNRINSRRPVAVSVEL